jgi:hypothetical protein
MRRWLGELRAQHTRADVEATFASLGVHLVSDDGPAQISRDRGSPLREAPHRRTRVVRIEPGVYNETRTKGARVELLTSAATIAPIVEVHAPLSTTGTHRGRVLVDLPRRGLRAAGREAAETGDRFGDAFVHAFFDDEPVLEEAREAGLSFVARRGAWIVFERGPSPSENPDSFATELGRVVALALFAERLRRRAPPAEAVTTMRERGRMRASRGPIGRARLRRAIGWVDASFPGGANCYRRTLLETGLDGGAAMETLVFGLDVARTGHVAFKGAEEVAEGSFDVLFEIPSPDGVSAE